MPGIRTRAGAAALVATAFAATALGQTGTILRERWTGIGGVAISDLTGYFLYPYSPNLRDHLTEFQSELDWGESYGSRVRGYIHPPEDGDYTFWLTTDDAGELWLSTDESPANKVRIAWVDTWAGWTDWTNEGNQTSAPIPLLAGQKYYVEVFQKEEGGGDHLRVRWQEAGWGAPQEPIPGSALSPWVASDLIGHWKLDEDVGSGTAADSSPNGYTGTVTAGIFVPAGGQLGGALSFDSLWNSYVGTGLSLLNNLPAFTLAGWVNASTASGSRIGLFGQNDVIEFGFDNDRLSVWTAPGGLMVQAPDPFPTGEWHHVAVVGTGASVTLYMDGQPLATDYFATTSYGTSAFPFNVGGGGIWDDILIGNWFTGLIDDVRVYPRALSAPEVAAVMGDGKCRYWVGGDGNWSDAAHWALYPGGAGGVSVPGADTVTFFDALSGTGTCTVDAAVDVKGLVIGGPSGLLGGYYDGTNFETFVRTLLDPDIAFPNGSQVLLGTRANSSDGNGFSVRWTGYVKGDFSEDYTFHLRNDDGARLTVDGLLVIDQWYDQGIDPEHAATATVSFVAGQWYPIVLELYQNGGDAGLELRYSSPSQAKVLVPSRNLYPGPCSMTVNQGSSALTIGAAGFEQVGGTFAGGSGTIDVNGDLTVWGGSFTSTSGALQVAGDLSAAGGTFTHNGGTLVLDGAADQSVDPGGNVFNNVQVSNAGATASFVSDTTLAGNLTVDAGAGVAVTAGNSLTLGASSTVSGSLTLGTETSLLLADGVIFDCDDTSSFVADGAGASFPILATCSGAGVYSFVLAGDVDLQYVQFEYLNAGGLVLSSVVGAVSAADVSFRSSPGGVGSTHMHITAAGTAWNGYTFDGFSFEGTGADDPSYAVRISSGGTVNMTNYDEGANRIYGDVYDDEVWGQVLWGGVPPAPLLDTATADDPSNDDNALDSGDTLTLVFNTPTNAGASNANGPKNVAAMDLLFDLSTGNWGTTDQYTLSWSSATTLQIEITTHVAASIPLTDQITVLGTANITDGGTSPACTDGADINGDWGTTPPPVPQIVRITARDPDNGDTVFGVGDTITIVFDVATNEPPAATGPRDGTLMPGLFQLSGGTWGGLADSYFLSWTNPRTLVVRVDARTTADVPIGATLTIQAGANIQNILGSAATTDSGVIGGSWGVKNDLPGIGGGTGGCAAGADGGSGAALACLVAAAAAAGLRRRRRRAGSETGGPAP